ncbi:hypothetical protein PR202_gb24491 [Eleusine coracana subsp. coracana]|uniref:Protein kinase domain-containing protein n=1 Tax=Eleusine coracana subsp. coracana TaxID=191504 RepID=A0AAV5FLR2_ELECO|nr:hypothetical protein PR202_gb24491 [Eleusine coracana subsp. coracana]
MLSFTVIKSITKNFSKEIGRGGFGVVYLGALRNGMVAVKMLSTLLDMEDKQFVDEINCLIRAKHKNIVRLLGYCADTQGEMMKFNGRYVLVDRRQRFLCFEYAHNGSLDSYLEGA